MKQILVYMLFGLLLSCQSKKALDLDIFLNDSEQKAYSILTADGMEKKRLEALVANRPDTALMIARNQSEMLLNTIKKINERDINDIAQAKLFKICTINYYTRLLQLKEVDIREAELMAAAVKSHGKNAAAAEREISGLPYKRLLLHNLIAESERARLSAKEKFKKANNIN